MKADNQQQLGFCQSVALAMLRLKRQLQHDDEQARPDLRDIISIVLDQEEKNAWLLSPIPHLLLPALLEARFGLVLQNWNLTKVCGTSEGVRAPSLSGSFTQSNLTAFRRDTASDWFARITLEIYERNFCFGVCIVRSCDFGCHYRLHCARI